MAMKMNYLSILQLHETIWVNLINIMLSRSRVKTIPASKIPYI